MSVVSVEARSFILALFIRDDGERFLLGDNGYDFIDSQLHFAANSIENDEVQKQGTDGVLVAGQVRRASVQTFDGYIGDATTSKAKIEQMRRDFFAFFAKGHHFRVIYVDCDRDAWQRKGGYLVDAPEVKELWQIHPEYHVGLNFEDVNYYEYDENAEGEEILSNILSVPISSEIEGGLEWDGDGAISELPFNEAKTATGNPISIADAVEAPLKSLEIQGETSQNGTPTPDAPVSVQVVTGENVVKIRGKNLLPIEANSSSTGGITMTKNADGSLTFNGTTTTSAVYFNLNQSATGYVYLESGKTYTLSTSTPLPSNTRLCCRNALGSTTNYIDIYGGNQTSKTKTMTVSDSTFTYFAIYNAGTTVNNLTIYPMLELGSSASSFEPYQEQSYDIDLTSINKNLFNKDKAENGYRIGANGSQISDAAYFISDWIPVEPNTQYVISPSTYLTYSAIATYKADGTLLTRLTGSSFSSITTESNAAYIRFATDINSIGTTQLEKGSAPTTYVACQPIELCKIGTYQDYIYKDGTDWKIHKEIGKSVLNGSEANWATQTSGGLKRYSVNRTDSKSFPSRTADASLSSHFTPSTADAVGIFFVATQTYYFYPDQTIATLDSWKTWLASNNVALYYQLATPTDTTITNTALIEQLEAILAGGTQAGVNTITLTPSAGATGILEVEYYSEYQDGGYVWEEGGSGGPTTIVNDSISAVYPVWTIYGPALNPQLENTTNNTTLEYVGIVADGQTLVIDMGAQTASLDGLNVLSALTGDFIQLEAGNNILLYSASNDAPASEIGWSEIVG